ncbi:uncharacterized protein F5147DRAFT_808719 [Suillus discolor]|uniref:Uncharacterized protein n=1 Tax=Suillus discolor TaxID=1912936 RepID=A0A9P7F1Y6_9AGAM|nr:uncharacterized protein F5147DRAFT_808719 [Suillus discolor]KAG2103742.1 hypothetical protein F5147DRAFT_808719 [Suillus discolor]
MIAYCPNCLKEFANPWAVTRHLNQPRTSCLRWANQLESASQILLDPTSQEDEHTTESSPNQTPSSSLDFPMDLESEALLGHWQDTDIPVDDPDCLYSDEGVTVNLESDVLGSTAKVYGRGQTFQDQFNVDAYAAHCKENIYYPFASLQDWELGSFLLHSSLSMAATDEFLGLKLVKGLPFSFCTAKDLRGRAELLPPVPKWQYRVISTTHPTKQPVHFYWRDPLDCIKALFNHPLFAKELDLTPTHVYDTVERTMQIYSEWMTGGHRMSQLPDGATLLGVILSSNKTNITNMTGGRLAYLLLISLANVKMAT